MNEEQDLEDDEIIIRGKWSMDGARTLTGAACMLRSLADDLEKMEAEGWQLIQPISDDYGFVRKK